MQLLGRLAEASYITIFVPELVKREFISKRIIEAREDIHKSLNNLRSISKKVSYENVLAIKSKEIIESLRKLEEIVEERVNLDFEIWVKSNQVEILPFNPDVATEVMNDYFLGNGVYKKAKSRDDIPDAFINASIKELFNVQKSLTIIIKDGTFKKYLEETGHYTVVDSLKTLLELKTYREKIDYLDAQFREVEFIKEYFYSEEFKNNLLKYFFTSPELIEDIYLEESDIELNEKLGIHTFGERFQWIQADKINALEIENVSWLSEDNYSIQLSFNIVGELDYCADYGEYLSIEDNRDRNISMDSMNSEGICDLSEIIELKLFGFLSLDMNEKLSLESIKVHSKYLEREDNPLSLTLDIESAIAL